jgi:hypothetical protein
VNRQYLLNVILIACTVASLGATLSLSRRVDAAERQLQELTGQPMPPAVSAVPGHRTPLPMPD